MLGSAMERWAAVVRMATTLATSPLPQSFRLFILER